MGYKFQFVTLAGFHSLNHGMFELAGGYRDRGMAAYSELQQAEFASEAAGYTATRHQREVGTGYFDAIATAISAGQASTVALTESTEAAQFVAAPEKERADGTSVIGWSAANIATAVSTSSCRDARRSAARSPTRIRRGPNGRG